MHMPEIQSVLNEKNISFSYVEEDNCGSIDFEHRGLRYHIWEFADDAGAGRRGDNRGMQGAMRKSKAITIRFSQNI